MTNRALVTTSAYAIGGVTLFFAGWALLDPESLAAKMGVSPRHAHWLGYRDLVSGGLLLTRGDTPAFALRALADVGDAVTLASSRPAVAAGAALFAAWSAAAALAARHPSRSPSVPAGRIVRGAT
jgi:hypothetical protein